MQHKLLIHTDCDKPGTCAICDGGLAYCTICKCGECELTEDCPGRVLSDFERDLVCRGELFFWSGVWFDASDMTVWGMM